MIDVIYNEVRFMKKPSILCYELMALSFVILMLKYLTCNAGFILILSCLTKATDI